MINERAVLTAKFWGELSSLRSSSGLREGEFEQFALIVLGMTCMEELFEHWPDELTSEKRLKVLEALEALREAGAHRDDYQFRRAWANAYDALFRNLPISSNIDDPPKAGSFHAFSDIMTILNFHGRAWSSKREFLLSCFDEAFHRVVCRITAIGYRSGDTAAALAAHLSARFDHISEYFSMTGEFAVFRQSVLDVTTTARISAIDRMNFLVCLRLYLHGISVDDRAPHEDDRAPFAARRFLLVDHPRRSTTGRRRHSSGEAEQQTSFEALDHLLESRTCPDLSLIVVPGVDRSAGGWRKELRESLVHSGRLLAVIDLPLERSAGSRKQVSAWFLSKGERSSNDVLMVDAKGLAGSGELREAGPLMAFVAAIVSFGAPEGWPSPNFARQLSYYTDDRESMLNAYFNDGYRDVEGVCRLVRAGELADNGYKLAASVYLGSTEKHKRFMPLLNSEPVLEALRQGHDHGTRIYIIGNNGEGKSILLSDLAERLVQQGRRVVGISFGLTDRFPFKRPKNDGQPFVYVGARTSERGIALGRTSAEVDRMVREIHVNTQRLDVFNSVVRHLGFGERRYLVSARPKIFAHNAGQNF